MSPLLLSLLCNHTLCHKVIVLRGRVCKCVVVIATLAIWSHQLVLAANNLVACPPARIVLPSLFLSFLWLTGLAVGAAAVVGAAATMASYRAQFTLVTVLCESTAPPTESASETTTTTTTTTTTEATAAAASCCQQRLR